MPNKVNDEQFLAAVESARTWPEVCTHLGVADLRSVMYRRRRFEAQYGVKLSPGRVPSKYEWHPQAFQHTSPDAYDAILFGDSHVWPGQYETPAFKALLIVAEEIRPSVCTDMGDSIDGATASRFPRIGWEKRPTLKEELDANREFRGRIDAALPQDCRKIWLLGNHDLRWMGRLANAVPEFEGVEGFDLTTMFPGWNFAKSLVLNDTLLCLHRYGSGIHAGYGNTLRAGVSTATGHDHKLEARPLTDFRGVRYGIRTGTLANIYGPQFEYTEQQPVDWCHGFVVVHIDGSRIWPEPVMVTQDEFRFRGKTYKIE